MIDTPRLVGDFHGNVITADHPEYAAAIRPVRETATVRTPHVILRCASERDVVAAVRIARANGPAVAVRGGGHCFAGRSSTDGTLIDIAGLTGVDLPADGIAVVGAGTRLGSLYPALHAAGRTLPAGCGSTVGIAGLTLGGGIGLLGRRHGLTCDQLVGARVVLADGDVVDCDDARHPDLFWALRGAGGGQFGIVTSLRFRTIPEPLASRIDIALPPDVDLTHVVATWQAWAVQAPEQISLTLTLRRAEGSPAEVLVSGACLGPSQDTRTWLLDFARALDAHAGVHTGEPGPFSLVKAAFADPREDEPGQRLRSGFFARPMSDETIAALVLLLGQAPTSHGRRLTFTPMGGAYSRVAPDATAFAHRGESYLLEHVGDLLDPWVDASWTVAHGDGTTPRVYPNFPDPLLEDPAVSYHGANHTRLAAIKRAYDPQRFFDFPHAV